jgi:hypothetical protein
MQPHVEATSSSHSVLDPEWTVIGSTSRSRSSWQEVVRAPDGGKAIEVAIDNDPERYAVAVLPGVLPTDRLLDPVSAAAPDTATEPLPTLSSLRQP